MQYYDIQMDHKYYVSIELLLKKSLRFFSVVYTLFRVIIQFLALSKQCKEFWNVLPKT